MNGLGVLCIIFTLIQLSFAETSTQKGQRISNVVAIVGRHFSYALPEDSNSRSAKYMVTEEGKKSLPKWLSFDREKNLLFGVPSWRDKGTYHLQVQSTDTFTLYVKDLHDVASDMKLRNSNVTKIPTIREIVCHSMLPVAAATIIFDLHAGKLGGKERSELLKRVAAFADVDVENLHMSLGKGHSTALNLKDVMMLTAGPGNVHEAKEPGVVISWQIGCGIDVAGTRTASLLKSSAETGAFAKALSSPVSGWHITTGFPKGPRRRARRQVIMKLYPTPTPSRKGPIPAGKVPGITATPLVTATPPSSVSRKVTVIIPTPTTTVPTRTVFPNTHPVVKAQFNPIVLYSGQVLRFSIPSNTFYDAEDGNTRVLTVKMYSISGATLGSSSWILLNDRSQEIYGLGLAVEGHIGAHQFLVSAVDSGGLSVQAPIMIQIQKDLHQYNHEFSLDMNMDYSLFSNNVELRVELLDLMATYFGVSSADIRAVSFSQAAGGGSGVNFKFHFAHVPNLPCDGTVIRGLIGKFGESSVSPKLVSTLGSKYAVRKGSYKLMGDCVNKPEVRNAIGQISALAGQAFDYTVPADVFFDVEDGYNLDLALRTQGLAQVPPMSWVLFNKNERKIYGLPMDDMITSHRYTLLATDSDDNIAMDTFSLNVGADSNRYNHEFTIVLDTDNVQFINSVDKRLALIKEIASYFQTDIKNVRVVNYGAGVSFTFRFSDVPYNDCKGRLKTLIDLFGKDEGQVNPAFKRALSFTITKGMYKLLGPCRVDVEPPQCNKRISIPYDVFAGQVFEYMIPADTCVDGIDGDMSKLDLKMTAIGGIDLASNSWILLDGPALRIFGLPMDSHSGDHEFDLTVKDSSGLPAKETFKIPVKKDTNPYNHIFNIVVEADRSKFENNVGVRIDFVKRLAAYFGVDPSKLRIASITPGSGPKEINLGFHIAGIPEKSCDGSELMKAINSFGMKSLTASFISSLAPDFVVKSGDYELLRECAQNNKPEVGQGVVPGDIPITTMGGQVKYYTIPANAFFDPEDGDTRKLTIRLLGPDGKPLPVDSWVRLDTDKQEIQALPMGSEVGPNTFIVEAVDSKGGKVNDTITIQVNEEPRNYTHQFTLMLNYDGKDNKFLEDVKERLDLIELLAGHFKVKEEDVRVISSGKGVKFSFYLSNIPDKPCNHPMRTKAVNLFGRNGEIVRSLRRALEKRFKPTKGFAEDIGKCSALGNIPPEVNRPLGTLTMDVGEPFIFKVPYDTFLDKNEINTRYLTLDLKNVDGSSLPSKKSWITLLDTQEIYALPQEPGTYTYILTASDRKNKAQDVFNIEVKKPTKPTTEFIMYLRTPKKPFMNDVKVPVKLAKKLADFLGVPVGTINILSYKPDGSTINFKFGLTNVPQEPCDHPMTVAYVKQFGANKASSGLKQAIHRYFNIKSAKVEQVGPCAPKPFNTPPDILNHVDRLDLFAHQGLRYVVPVDAYYDKEDGTTRELVLSLRLEGRKDQVLLPTSWILMNSTSQEIYALPMPEFSGLHNFAIEAKDSGGKTIYDAVEVLVKEDNTPFNHKFTIFLDNDNATFLNNVGVRLGLVQKLADYFGVNLTNIRVDEYGPGPYMTFHLDNIPYGDCSSVYFDKFGSDKVNTDLKTALQPEYRVVDGSYITTEPCSGVVSGVAATPNAARGVWWSATLIPVIVVGIVLLVLGLCLLFVLRRKKKRGLSADDAKTFIYKRKPVVFKEEYDVKEDLLKQPLVVPNEKPPLPPPAYPRTPNGSAVTTPMDERRAYQAPSFTSSRQMSASSNGSAMVSSGGSAGGAAMAGGGGGSGSAGAGGAGGGGMSAGGGSMSAGGAAMGAGTGGEGGGMGGGGMGGGGMGGGGGGMGGGGGGMGGGGGGMGGGGAGGVGAGGGSAGGGAGGAAMSGGGAMNSSKSSSYSYNSSNQSGSARKGAYSGYRLPPAYVPP